MKKKPTVKELAKLPDEKIIEALQIESHLSDKREREYHNRINKMSGDTYVEASQILKQLMDGRQEKTTHWRTF